MIAITNHIPWTHWIVDNFLTPECLGEVKSIDHTREQLTYGKRVGGQRLFIEKTTA